MRYTLSKISDFMKYHILSILLILFFLSSCGSTKNYYFFLVLDEGDKFTHKTDSGLFENVADSLTLRYMFSGENISLNLEVDNHKTKPITIDWDKSYIQINDMSPRIYSDIQRSNVLDKSHIGSFERKNYGLLENANFNFRAISKKEYKIRQKKPYGVDVEARSLEFYPSTTPLYLTSKLCLLSESGDHQFLFNSFYMSSLNRISKSDYKKLKKRVHDRGDFLFVHYQTDRDNQLANSFFGALIGVTLMVIDAKIDQSLGIDDNDY